MFPTCNSMMEVFQLKTNSWFLSKQLFVEDPLLSTSERPIFCHILTGTLASPRKHTISILNYDDNLLKYLWRYKSRQGLVHIYNVSVETVTRSDAEVSVLCEMVCVGVEKIVNLLGVEEQLYLICAVARLVKVISDELGFFGLANGMIGLDKEGHVRMWVNENYASNQRQIELGSEEEQLASMLAFFQRLRFGNQLVNAYLHNFQQMQLRLQDHQDYHSNFMRLHHLKGKDKVNLSRLPTKWCGSLTEKEPDSLPPSSHKIGNQTADVSSSLKEYSLNCRLSEPPTLPTCKSSEIPKYHPGLTLNQEKLNQQNRQSLQSRLKSCQKTGTQSMKTSVTTKKGGLASRAKLEESIFCQDDVISVQKQASQLQLLGKMGKVCVSMTPEELILQQFRQIYQLQ